MKKCSTNSCIIIRGRFFPTFGMRSNSGSPRTPVDEWEVREHPRVIFRIGENTWLEAIVRYLVAPREAGRVKTRLIKKLLAALNAAPDKVMFPAGANR